MIAVQAVELGLAGLPAADYPLRHQPVGRSAHPFLGAMAEDPMDVAAGELFSGPRKHAEDVPVKGGSNDAERTPKVHGYANNNRDIPIIVGIPTIGAVAGDFVDRDAAELQRLAGLDRATEVP